MLCAESFPSQFHSIGHLKGMQHPENAALDIALCEVQLLAISRWFKPSPSQTINGSQHANSQFLHLARNLD
jgi:hypothetical protein